MGRLRRLIVALPLAGAAQGRSAGAWVRRASQPVTPRTVRPCRAKRPIGRRPAVVCGYD